MLPLLTVNYVVQCLTSGRYESCFRYVFDFAHLRAFDILLTFLQGLVRNGSTFRVYKRSNYDNTTKKGKKLKSEKPRVHSASSADKKEKKEHKAKKEKRGSSGIFKRKKKEKEDIDSVGTFPPPSVRYLNASYMFDLT